jgi:hypothetical protein
MTWIFVWMSRARIFMRELSYSKVKGREVVFP